MSAYVMRISDWSSDVCSSDLTPFGAGSSQTPLLSGRRARQIVVGHALGDETVQAFEEAGLQGDPPPRLIDDDKLLRFGGGQKLADVRARYRKARSEEHTSELQSLMRISYAVFCLQTKKTST